MYWFVEMACLAKSGIAVLCKRGVFPTSVYQTNPRASVTAIVKLYDIILEPTHTQVLLVLPSLVSRMEVRAALLFMKNIADMMARTTTGPGMIEASNMFVRTFSGGSSIAQLSQHRFFKYVKRRGSPGFRLAGQRA